MKTIGRFRSRVRIVKEYIKEAKAVNPNATSEELHDLVRDDLTEDFGEDNSLIELLLKLLVKLLPLFI